jgi:hypothetical protein
MRLTGAVSRFLEDILLPAILEVLFVRSGEQSLL